MGRAELAGESADRIEALQIGQAVADAGAAGRRDDDDDDDDDDGLSIGGVVAVTVPLGFGS